MTDTLKLFHVIKSRDVLVLAFWCEGANQGKVYQGKSFLIDKVLVCCIVIKWIMSLVDLRAVLISDMEMSLVKRRERDRDEPTETFLLRRTMMMMNQEENVWNGVISISSSPPNFLFPQLHELVYR